MAHTIEEKTKLLQRVRRLRGQVDAIERAVQADAGCAKVMQLTVSVRGAAKAPHRGRSRLPQVAQPVR